MTSFNITITSRIDLLPACDRRAAVRIFIFSTGWYGYVRLSHMGNNPALVCKSCQSRPKLVSVAVFLWKLFLLQMVGL